MKPIDYQRENPQSKFLDYIPGLLAQETESDRIYRMQRERNGLLPRVITKTEGRRFGLYSAVLWRQLNKHQPVVVVAEAGVHYQIFDKAAEDPMIWPLVIPGRGRVEDALELAQKLQLNAGIGLNTYRARWEHRLSHLVDAGASFVMTQPIYLMHKALDLASAVAEIDPERERLAYWVGVQRPKLVNDGKALAFSPLPRAFGRSHGRYDEQKIEADYGYLRKQMQSMNLHLYVMQMRRVHAYDRYDGHQHEQSLGDLWQRNEPR